MNYRFVCHLKRQVQRVPGKGLELFEPKGEAGSRVIVLGPSALEKLRDQREYQELQKLFSPERWQESGMIFTTSIGTMLHPNSVYQDFILLSGMQGCPESVFTTCATPLLH